jgi:HSP20 family molecular chaperone IbpA
VIAAEFAPGDYRRSFTVPRGLDPDKVKAEFSNGVLSLHLPKSSAIKPRQIKVQAG